MPNVEELISKISAKLTKGEGEIWMSKNDLDYAYGQPEAQLSTEAAKHCVFSIIGGNFTGHYRFIKGFYGLSDIPTVFQENIDAVLEFKTPVWLDDILCVTPAVSKTTKKWCEKIVQNCRTPDIGSAKRKQN